MTSVLRRVAQQNPQTQYFYCNGSVQSWILNVSAGIAIAPVMEMAQFTAAFSSNALAGPLLKDLGRQITVYDNSTAGVVGSPHIAIFRQVMDVNGLNTEGVVSPQPVPPAAQTIAYICTWVDVSLSPRSQPYVLADVARTG